MQRPMVVLPLPLSPTRPRVSPRWMSKLTPSTALILATVRSKMTPAVMGKYIFTSSTRTRTSSREPLVGLGDTCLLTIIFLLGRGGDHSLVGLAHPPPPPAGAAVPIGNQHEGRGLLPAALDHEGAAGPEGAARGQLGHIRG